MMTHSMYRPTRDEYRHVLALMSTISGTRRECIDTPIAARSQSLHITRAPLLNILSVYTLSEIGTRPPFVASTRLLSKETQRQHYNYQTYLHDMIIVRQVSPASSSASRY